MRMKRRRFSRRNPGSTKMTPEQKADWERAEKLALHARVIRNGAAIELLSEYCDTEDMSGCITLLNQAMQAELDAKKIRDAVREELDAAEDAEEEIEPVRGRPLQ